MTYGLTEAVKEVLGSKDFPFIPYQENASWREYLPKYENQTTKIGEETSGCTVWGWQNAFEIFEKGVYGVEPNYSERFTYLLAGVTPKGGKDPNDTLKAILEHGLVNDAEMPMTRSLVDFLDTDDLTGSLLAKGQNWLIHNELLATELWNVRNRPKNYKEILKDNLKRCPVPISVSAWNQTDGVYVSDKGSVNNHFCVAFEVIDYKQYKDCVVVFDTYDHSIKILHPEHNIRRAFAFWINKKTATASKRHVSILEAIIKLLKRPKPMHPIPNYPVSQKFLVSSKEYESGVHNGTDWVCPVGTPVCAPEDGDIIHIFRNHSTMGNCIYFATEGGKYMRFMHLSEVGIRGFYKQGEVLGKTGNTGKSTAPHIHIDVWNVPINTNLIKTRQGVEKYLIDPEKYFTMV